MSRRHRPYWRSVRTYWYWIAIAAILVLQWFAYPPGPAAPAGSPTLSEGIHEVRRVVDGDTLLLESGARVRLVGIDTPEIAGEHTLAEAWGAEASRFTKDFVKRSDGRVRLTFGNERIDDYGRYLAFVWIGDKLLNEELVRAGLAEARLRWRYSESMKRRLRLAQEDARRAKRGIWSDTRSSPLSIAP
jgi:micrococcal nuclease